MTTPPDIFLSYNREDQARAKHFAEAFEGKGFKVWWDVGLRTGEAYDEVTETALRTAKAVVVLWSKKSVQSRWVRAEATLADRNKTLVPCMIEPCERPIMFELTQTAELGHWQGDAGDKAWVAFLADVKRFVAKDALATEDQPTLALPIAPQPLAAKPSIVIRPFATMAGAGEADFFADGMIVEVVSALSRFPSLFVISSGTSLNLRGDVRSNGEITRELGVRYVLQGSVRKGGNAVRIAVELLDGDVQTPIWTQRFDGVLDDIFALQDEIANAVAARIDANVFANEMRRAKAQPTKDMSAYDYFLRGTHNMWARYEETELREAIALLDLAVALDPDFALAMVLCSNACFNLQAFHPIPDRQAILAKCLSLAQRAVALRNDDYRIIGWASYSYLQCGEPMAKVNPLIDRALALNPGDSMTHWLSGWVSIFTPNPQKAFDAFETALRLDPRSPWRFIMLGGKGIALFQLDRFEEAAPLMTEAQEHVPAVRPLLSKLVTAAFALSGRVDDARAFAGGAFRLEPENEAWLDLVRDGSLKPKVIEGLRLAREDTP
jgi:TolB-like protein